MNKLTNYYRCAQSKWIASEPCVTITNWYVVDNMTSGVRTTRANARISAPLIDTS